LLYQMNLSEQLQWTPDFFLNCSFYGVFLTETIRQTKWTPEKYKVNRPYE
jgi:hypothetical protein